MCPDLLVADSVDGAVRDNGSNGNGHNLIVGKNKPKGRDNPWSDYNRLPFSHDFVRWGSKAYHKDPNCPERLWEQQREDGLNMVRYEQLEKRYQRHA